MAYFCRPFCLLKLLLFISFMFVGLLIVFVLFWDSTSYWRSDRKGDNVAPLLHLRMYSGCGRISDGKHFVLNCWNNSAEGTAKDNDVFLLNEAKAGKMFLSNGNIVGLHLSNASKIGSNDFGAILQTIANAKVHGKVLIETMNKMVNNLAENINQLSNKTLHENSKNILSSILENNVKKLATDTKSLSKNVEYLSSMATKLKQKPLLTSYPLEIDMPEVVKKYKTGNIPYKPINVFEYKVIYGPSQTCKKRKISIVFIIKSAIVNFARRSIIRKTWANDKMMAVQHIARIFVVGSSEHKIISQKLSLENERYSDILQFDFLDNYFNNTLKTTGALNWANEFCNQSKFVMFLDDDFFVSTENLVKYINSVAEKNKGYIYAGNVNTDEPVRDKNIKWYVSEEDYPYSKYPPFIRGGAWLASMPFITDLSIAIQFTKRFIFDDVFIAIVAQKLKVKPTHEPRFSIGRVSYRSGDKFRSVLASHGYGDPVQVYRAWRYTIDQDLSFNYTKYYNETVVT